MINLYQGDCLTLMHLIPAQSVDLILCDLPYGTTQNKWDSVIPFEPLWAHYKRICKGAIALTAAQPFTSSLVMSNVTDFKYAWVWDKVAPTGFLNAKKQPLRRTEDVCLFWQGSQTTYNPQMIEGKPIKRTASKSMIGKHGGTCYREGLVSPGKDTPAERYPVNIMTISNGHSPNTHNFHPTQKPVALMEYLIRTYTNDGDTVLDNCMGSGTTGVACVNTGRSFIGIEQDAKYFEIAKQRIEAAR